MFSNCIERLGHKKNKKQNKTKQQQTNKKNKEKISK